MESVGSGVEGGGGEGRGGGERGGGSMRSRARKGGTG